MNIAFRVETDNKLTSKDSASSSCGDEHEFILAYTEQVLLSVTDNAPPAGLGSGTSPPLLCIVYNHKLQVA